MLFSVGQSECNQRAWNLEAKCCVVRLAFVWCAAAGLNCGSQLQQMVLLDCSSAWVWHEQKVHSEVRTDWRLRLEKAGGWFWQQRGTFANQGRCLPLIVNLPRQLLMVRTQNIRQGLSLAGARGDWPQNVRAWMLGHLKDTFSYLAALPCLFRASCSGLSSRGNGLLGSPETVRPICSRKQNSVAWSACCLLGFLFFM